MKLTELSAPLAAAYRAGLHAVDPAPYRNLSLEDAYAIQTQVLAAVGETVGMLKTARRPDGIGIASPIYRSGVGRAPGFRLPSASVVGVEVEVGMVLGRDVKSSADVVEAIDHFFTGVEVCGTRYTDRTNVGTFGGLADSQSAYGYVVGPDRVARDAIDGLQIEIEFNDKQIYVAPAKHGFGSVLASLQAYADHQRPSLPLLAGTIVTTGSMCGLVLTSGPGHVVCRLGDQIVEFDLV